MNSTTPRIYTLEPSLDEMKSMGELCVDFIAHHIESLPLQDSQSLEEAGKMALHFREEPPEEGAPFEELLEIFSRALPYSMNSAGPGYMAFIPGGGLYEAALADFIACATNRYVGVWGAAPALARLELNVIHWLCRWMGYHQDAMGILTSGGSMANFSAIVTARTAMLPENFLSGTIYTTSQCHHSIVKSARLAGFPASAIRTVNVDKTLAMDTVHLKECIEADRKSGLTPFLIVANAGTTNTGTVDPLDEMADIASSESLWLHADGAYGGFFYLTERGRTRLRGMERAHSITLDPHKGLFLPYGTGCLLVREGKYLKKAHSFQASYLQDIEDGESVNFSDYSPELSREFRGFRVWLPLRLYGIAAFRRALDEKLDLAEYAHEALSASGLFDMAAPLHLSVVTFRARCSRGDADELNRRLLERVNAEKRVFLSSTVIDGRFTLRICVLSFRNHRERVEEAVESLIRNTGKLTQI
ncbi:MAG: aspartate aminotransferase family protein [Vulcanimicrobiota bacterium]